MTDAAQVWQSVWGVLALDPEAMRAIAGSPDGLRVALGIILLAGLSDALGNSPVLFLSGVGGGRFFACLVVDTLLSVLRTAVWVVSLVVLFNLLPGDGISLPRAVLVVGIGMAPMLFGFLALLPLVGPALLRLLQAWTVVVTTVALGAILGLVPGEAVAVEVVGWVVAVVLGRSVDRLLLRGAGWVSLRLLGVDLALRFGQVDLVARVLAGAPRAPGAPGVGSAGVGASGGGR